MSFGYVILTHIFNKLIRAWTYFKDIYQSLYQFKYFKLAINLQSVSDRQTHFFMIIKMFLIFFFWFNNNMFFTNHQYLLGPMMLLTTAKQALSARACACLWNSMSTYGQTCWTFRLIFAISQSLSDKGERFNNFVVWFVVRELIEE